MLIKKAQHVSRSCFDQYLRKSVFWQSTLATPITQLQRQRAELSFKLYELIKQKPKVLDIKNKSLHQLIIEKINEKKNNQQAIPSGQERTSLRGKKQENENFVYHAEVRQPFIDMFEKGFEIDPYIFNQDRIRDGRTGPAKKFIFHPTYLVTSQIFKEIEQFDNSNAFLTGHYGISKTVSVCLYWYLTKYMNEYRFQKDANVSQEMKKIPKIFYIMINKNQQYDVQSFRKYILNQCPEFHEHLKSIHEDKDYIMSKSKSRIKEFYYHYFPEKKLTTILICDQINDLAKIGKKKVHDIQKFVLKQNDGLQPKIQNQSEQTARFLRVKKLIETFFIQQFTSVLYLSSIALQQLFFKQIDVQTVSNIKKPEVKKVKYAQTFYQRDSIIELIQYFLFEMNQRVYQFTNYKNDDPEADIQIKEHCFKYLNEKKKQDYFFTFYTLRQKIAGIAKDDFPQINTKKQYVQKTKKIFEDMVTYSTNFFVNLLKNSIESKKNNDDIINFMMMIYNYLIIKKKDIVKQQLQNKKLSEIQEDRLEPNISLIPLTELNTSSFFLKSDLIEKRIFSHTFGSQYLQLLLPSNFIIKILDQFRKQFRNNYLGIALAYLQKHGTGSYEGNFLQNHFQFCLYKGNVNLSLKYIENYQRWRDRTFNFSNNSRFRFLSLQHKRYQIIPKFQEIIQKIINKNLKQAVCFPVKKIYEKSEEAEVKHFEINPISKLVDIAFIQMYQGPQQVNAANIILVDLTINKEKETKDKITEFLEYFLELKDKETHSIELKSIFKKCKINFQYFVISPYSVSNKQFKTELTQKFKDKIEFITDQKNLSNVIHTKLISKKIDQKSNQEQVELKQCILKRVGWIDLQKGVSFESSEKEVLEQIAQYKEITLKVMRSRNLIY